MTQLDLGRLGVWGHLDTLAAPDVIAYARRAEELGYGTLWVPETVGREPIALCSLLAAATDRINLGTSIINIWGRDAQAARMAALTLAEASGGRFVLGLGVSHPHLAGKLRGHRFERPLSRMREYLAAFARPSTGAPCRRAAPSRRSWLPRCGSGWSTCQRPMRMVRSRISSPRSASPGCATDSMPRQMAGARDWS